MPIKSSGTLSFSNIRNEAGPAGTSSVSLSSYRGAMAGIPLSGPIEMSDFYGKAFLVTEIITEDTVWSPKINFARFIHIFVVGAGGSGGASWPKRNEGTIGTTDGVAASSGGAGAGVAYSRISSASASTANIVIGSGGASVITTLEGNAQYGNSGTNTTFIGSGLTMIGGGGGRGQAATNADGQSSSVSTPASTGGVASGGNISNFTGGQGGGCYIIGTGVGRAAAGGGAIAFSSDHDSLKNAATASINFGNVGTGTGIVTTPGSKVSDYNTYPYILSSYIENERSQTPVLDSSITDFDATNGSASSGVQSVNAAYGAGSGGSCSETNPVRSGKGGDGVVIIVYEI